jgi:hypothetical protein
MRAWNTSRMKAWNTSNREGMQIGEIERCITVTLPGRWCQGSASRNAAGTRLRTTDAPRERRLFRLQLRKDIYIKACNTIRT